VRERLKQDDRAIPRSVEGERDSSWIVADYLDVVLHIFTPETRRYYRLEELWGDVPTIELEAASA
jgi:ribosome-associated protein